MMEPHCILAARRWCWRAPEAVLLVSLALFANQSSAAPSEIYLPSQSTNPGGSIVIPVAFEPRAGSVSGVQFDLQYDNSAMSLAGNVGDAVRISGKSLYCRDLAPGKRRFVIVGLNQNEIPPGTLIEFIVNLNPSAPTGIYPLAFSNVLATDPSGKTAPIVAAEGSVMVERTNGPTVRLQPAGVLSAASLAPGSVAPGEVVTLLGSGIGPDSVQQPSPAPSNTVLGEMTVLIDGIPAPLLFASLNQVNIVIPYAVSGKATTQLRVSSGSQVIAELTMPVAAAVPGIFTLDATGVGPGAILNQDLTVNSPSNPAPRGSVVALFATGSGQSDPPGTDGQVARVPWPKPVLPISVLVGGLDAEILYARAAPELIAGMLQVNCRIPEDVASGDAVPIVLKAGTVSSQLGVTVSVR
jgi:uncharacterized protein (TIGR03437 family)